MSAASCRPYDYNTSTFMFTIMQSDVVRTVGVCAAGRSAFGEQPASMPWCTFPRFLAGPFRYGHAHCRCTATRNADTA